MRNPRHLQNDKELPRREGGKRAMGETESAFEHSQINHAQMPSESSGGQA